MVLYKKGSKGEVVRQIQKALHLYADGIFGILTEEAVKEFQKDPEKSLIIITHSTRILESLHVDRVHVIVDGKVAETSDYSLVDKINSEGFEKYLA